MDFRSLNKYNVIVNAASGNFLPLTEENTSLSLPFAAYSIFVWLIDLTYITTMIIGVMSFLPALEAARTSGVAVTICLELLCLVIYLTYRSKYLRIFIQQMNSLLVDSDDLRRCIRECIEPHKNRLKLYGVLNITTWVMWELLALETIRHKDQFTYTDFKIASYFPGVTITANVLILGTLFRAIAGAYIMLKKIGVDVYMNYYITLLTAEYRYLQVQIAAAMREKDEILVIKALKGCVARHCNTIKTGAILMDVLSFNVGVIYVNCIFRFCFTACMIITVQSFFDTFLTLIFAMGSLIQIYLLCSSIHDLLDASTAISNEAFYENWHEHSRSVRSIFCTIGLGSQIECRLTAFGVFDLTVPTVATILKHSYSACLLVMNIQ